MYEHMIEVFPDAMVNNTQEGFDAIKNGDGTYAFLWDNSGTA